jgi:mannose-6-phosphate isomerase-like protein (cupin superfamily)
MSISSPPLLHDDLLNVVAQGLAAATRPWELTYEASPDERQHALLISTDVYEAWLIYWPPGTGLEPHDHGGSSGAFAVVTGTLDEDSAVGGGTVTTRVGPGDSLTFDGSHVHAVVNRGDTSVTSVHVYSPPLRAMGYFQRGDDGTLVLHRVDEIDSPKR